MWPSLEVVIIFSDDVHRIFSFRWVLVWFPSWVYLMPLMIWSWRWSFRLFSAHNFIFHRTKHWSEPMFVVFGTGILVVNYHHHHLSSYLVVQPLVLFFMVYGFLFYFLFRVLRICRFRARFIHYFLLFFHSECLGSNIYNFYYLFVLWLFSAAVVFIQSGIVLILVLSYFLLPFLSLGSLFGCLCCSKV